MPDAPRDSDPTSDSETTREPEPSEHPHRQTGPYRLLHRVGEGGMGRVWLAERQALAFMDHPSIATVFDGGTTPSGATHPQRGESLRSEEGL